MSTNPELFMNALQLSLNSKIDSIAIDPHRVVLDFERFDRNDSKTALFEKLVPGNWVKPEKSYQINDPHTVENELLINFLQLSRLEEKNAVKLAEIDPRYRPFVDQMGLLTNSPIMDFSSLNSIIFKKIQERKMTLRELSEKTGISQVALSQLKKGRDMRLSNLFKILKALGMILKLE